MKLFRKSTKGVYVVMQSILRIKQRRSISLASLNGPGNASEMLRLCLMRRMLCMTVRELFEQLRYTDLKTVLGSGSPPRI